MKQTFLKFHNNQAQRHYWVISSFTTLSVKGLIVISFVFAMNNVALAYPAADGIQLPGFRIYPELSVTQGYNDNYLLRSEQTLDTHFTDIEPVIGLKARDNWQSYSALYKLKSGAYSENDNDKYTDHYIGGTALWLPDYRNSIRLSGSFNATHEDRGTGISQGEASLNFDGLVEFEESEVNLDYTLGSDISEGNLQFSTGWLRKNYTNFKEVTDSRDRDILSGTLRFLWRPGKTGLIAEVNYKDIDYLRDPSPSPLPDSLDSYQTRLLAGISWGITGKTTGSLKLGNSNKVFDDQDREEFSEFSWATDVTWKPVPHSELIFTFSRLEQESDGSGDFTDRKTLELTWNHQWTPELATLLKSEFDRDEFIGDPDGRKDDVTTLGFSVNYLMRHWLDISFKTDWTDKSSNVNSFDYSRFRTALKLTARL